MMGLERSNLGRDLFHVGATGLSSTDRLDIHEKAIPGKHFVFPIILGVMFQQPLLNRDAICLFRPPIWTRSLCHDATWMDE